MARSSKQPAEKRQVPAGGLLKSLMNFRRSPIVRLFGNFGGPIFLKEIRSDFRKNRFFITHLICLSILASAILWKVMIQSEERNIKPEQIGRDLFNTFFLIQYLVVVIVFPAFSASTFSEERSSLTFDLLITSDLRPGEVVWGKFFASSSYCLIYILATLPLLSISLLFAGVTLLEIGLAYLLLIGLTILITMAGVFISSCFASNIRANFTMYILSFLILLYSWRWWERIPKGDESTLVREALARIFLIRIGEDLLNVLPKVLWILWIFALVFAYFFLFAQNRIRPRSDDRTSALRILTFIAFLSALASMAMDSLTGRKAVTQEWELQKLSAILFAIGILFTSETSNLSERLRQRFALWSGLRYPLRIFAPGAFWGLGYSLVLSLITCSLLAVRWHDSLAGGGGPEMVRFMECLITIPIYLFAFHALGFFLSTCGFTPLYTSLTVVFIFIITLLLPVIFQISGHSDSIVSFYYLSPITLWISLDPNPLDPEGPSYMLFGIHIIRIAQGLFGGLGILFMGLGVRRSLQQGFPLLTFLPSKR